MNCLDILLEPASSEIVNHYHIDTFCIETDIVDATSVSNISFIVCMVSTFVTRILCSFFINIVVRRHKKK